MQSHHRGALVVQAATAHKVTVLLGHLERLERPARTGGHDVHVTDDAQLLLGLAGKIRKPDMPLAVRDGHAHTLGDFQRRIQRSGRPRPVRRARSGSGQILRRGDFHELGDIGHNRIAMFIPISLGSSDNFLAVHRRSFHIYCPLKRGTP